VTLAMTVDALSASDFPLNTDGDRRRVADGLDTWLAEYTSINNNFKEINTTVNTTEYVALINCIIIHYFKTAIPLQFNMVTPCIKSW